MSEANNILTLGVALQKNKEIAAVTAQEKAELGVKLGFLKEKERLDAIGDRRKQYEVIMSALSEENIDRIKLSQKFQVDRRSLLMKLMDKTLGPSQVKSLTAELTRNMDQQDKLLKDLDVHDWAAFESVIDDSTDAQGSNRPRAILDTLTRPNTFADGTKLVNPQNQKQLNTIRKGLEAVNEAAKQEIIKFDDSTGLITNMDELQDKANFGKNSPFVKIRYRGSEVGANIFRNDNNILEAYNVNRQLQLDDLAAIDGENEEIRANIELLKAERDPKKISALAATIAGEIGGIDQILSEGAAISLEDLDQVGESIELYNNRKANAEGLQTEIDELSGTSETERTPSQRELYSKLEIRAASPIVREWAADHGFSEMGTVDYDKDGVPIPGSYVPGRDDGAIARTYNREFNRGAGRYGFRSIGTGDIVQFTTPDGKTHVGERLKFHAADRGAVRVAVPNIKEPIVISPKDNLRVVVLKSDPDKMSPLARRAKGLLRRKGDELKAMGAQFEVQDRSGEIARSKDGQLIIDPKTGDYINQVDYDKQVSDKLAETAIVGKYVDGTQYLVDSSGKVFEISASRDVVEVVDEDRLSKINEAPSRPILVKGTDDAGGETVSPVTMEMIMSGDELNMAMGSLETDPGGVDPDEAAKFGLVDEQRRATALESLNFESTDEKYDPYKGRTENERNIGGTTFVDLTGDPQAVQEYEEEEGSDAIQPVDEDAIELATAEEVVSSTDLDPSESAEAKREVTEMSRRVALSQADDAISESRMTTREDPLGKPEEAPPRELEPYESLPDTTWTPPIAGPLADLTEMSDEEAKARVEGTYEEPKPGASEIEGSGGLIAGVPSSIGTRQDEVLRSRERGADDADPRPIDLPELEKGSYKGRGGYEYQVLPLGEIKITKTPSGRGVGTVVVAGDPKTEKAHAAITNELAKGDGPKPPLEGVDFDAITAPLPPPPSTPPVAPPTPTKIADPEDVKRKRAQLEAIVGEKSQLGTVDQSLIDKFKASTGTVYQGVGDDDDEEETVEVDEVTQAAGTPVAVFAPGQDTKPKPLSGPESKVLKLLEGSSDSPSKVG